MTRRFLNTICVFAVSALMWATVIFTIGKMIGA